MDRKTKNPHIDHDLPIREDIRLLGRILGDTLYEQEGPAAFDLVEHIRQTSIKIRNTNDLDARHELKVVLNNLQLPQAVQVIRAFTHFLHLTNVAEEDQHYIRCARADELAGLSPREGAFSLAIDRAMRASINHEKIQNFLQNALVVPVFTAHPTEVQRKSILFQLQIETVII